MKKTFDVFLQVIELRLKGREKERKKALELFRDRADPRKIMEYAVGLAQRSGDGDWSESDRYWAENQILAGQILDAIPVYASILDAEQKRRKRR